MNQNWDQQIVLWPNDDQCLQLYETKLPQLWLCYTKGNRPSLQMSYDEGAWKAIHRCHVWYQCYRTFITSALFMKSRRKSLKPYSSEHTGNKHGIGKSFHSFQLSLAYLSNIFIKYILHLFFVFPFRNYTLSNQVIEDLKSLLQHNLVVQKLTWLIFNLGKPTKHLTFWRNFLWER